MKTDTQTVFNDIMNIIANGTMPWEIPWIVQGDKNAFTSKAYRGGNKLLLGYFRKLNPSYKNIWLTFKQAKKFATDMKFMEKAIQVLDVSIS